ncbi:MAG: Single-stranded DNA-binding protein ssb [candidate division CPR1 bacterium ADurb.Bin160]|uniref:Single-stranded DNA-binding protein n=1 Tax=candidate division CPR1 bacterium ADurb.Bin160 TaxID=1852826 RepID=A0A1V5ZKY0_9BACT|nr:MAG: Single-stranded DNA-binding protein ssb [candidate division CPR1 bacterium ADurb.Bin160]
MNSINIIGRLTSDPTLRTSEKGNQIANFSVAVDDTGKRTDFFDCAAFTKTAETVSKYLKKGCKVGITGRLRIDKYEKDGIKHKAAYIIVQSIDFIEKPKEEQK